MLIFRLCFNHGDDVSDLPEIPETDPASKGLLPSVPNPPQSTLWPCMGASLSAVFIYIQTLGHGIGFDGTRPTPWLQADCRATGSSRLYRLDS